MTHYEKRLAEIRARNRTAAAHESFVQRVRARAHRAKAAARRHAKFVAEMTAGGRDPWFYF